MASDTPRPNDAARGERLPSPSGDRQDDLAAPDRLAALGPARTGGTGSGSLYDPAEEKATREASDDASPTLPASMTTGTPADDLGFRLNPADVTNEDDGETLDAAPTDHPRDPLGEHGASDTVLGSLTPGEDAFGPGSGALGDTNSPSDEVR